MEAYGCSPDKEIIPGFYAYVVLLMGKNGDHKLIKSCISEKPSVISYVMEINE